MKKALFLAVVLLCASTFAFGDQITFSAILGSSHSVDISLGGALLGPAMNINVSDQQTGQVFPLDGVFTASTGKSTNFSVLTTPPIVLANYNFGSPNSVLITDTMGNVLVAGTMEDRSSVAATYMGGTGAFLGEFSVKFVSPAVLKLFGFGPTFQDSGSVSATFGQTEMNGPDNFVAELGGANVTIQTPVQTSTPEVATVLLMVTGIVLLGMSRKIRIV